MPFYHQLGSIPSKRHICHTKPDGKSLYREELVSSIGFSGIYSNKYHILEPTRFKSVSECKAPESMEEVRWDDALVQHYHFRTDEHKSTGDFIRCRALYLWNQHCRMLIGHPTKNTEEFYRNLYHHELVFIHHGQGKFLSEYGKQTFGPGDQIVIPKGTTYQLHFDDFSKNKIVIVESTTPYNIPKNYRNEYGQMKEDAPYCERDLRPPQFMEPKEKLGEFTILSKAQDRWFSYVADHHPFDLIGWDGFLYPFIFNMKDFCPKVGKVHLPPPVHIVFTTQQFVYCNFCPRLFDWHPEAIAVPYYHYNIDSDEVLYYVEGDFMSRSGVGEGSVTLHPQGLTHGPQPGKVEEHLGSKETHEYALMVDTFDTLYPTRHVEKSQDSQYMYSWLPENKS